MESKAVKRYLARLRGDLTCSPADRERLLSRGKALLEEFGEENPNAGYGELEAAFGQPGDFAAEMLSQLSPAEVEKARKRRKYIRRGAAAAVVIALILCSVYWGLKWTKAQSVLRGDFYVVETVEPETEEEFDAAWGRTPEQAHSYKGE